MRLFVFGPRVTCTIYSTAFMPNAIIMHTWQINVFLPRPEFSCRTPTASCHRQEHSSCPTSTRPQRARCSGWCACNVPFVAAASHAIPPSAPAQPSKRCAPWRVRWVEAAVVDPSWHRECCVIALTSLQLDAAVHRREAAEEQASDFLQRAKASGAHMYSTPFALSCHTPTDC